jgi:hypothetical protein
MIVILILMMLQKFLRNILHNKLIIKNMNVIEYWGVKKDGTKFLDTIKTKSSRNSKVKIG